MRSLIPALRPSCDPTFPHSVLHAIPLTRSCIPESFRGVTFPHLRGPARRHVVRHVIRRGPAACDSGAVTAHSSARQRLSRWFSRRIAQRMAADCSYLRLSTAFPTVCAPYCSADGSALPILPLVNGFPHGLRTILRSGWQRIAHTSTRQRLSRRFARRIAQRTTAHCSFFRSSTAFPMVRAPYCAVDGSGLLIPPLVNGFHHGLRAVLLNGWQRIAHSSARHRISRFARRFALQMAADCSFFRSLTSIIPGRFGYRIPQRMAADCSFLHSSTACTMVLAPYYSADG